MQAIAVHVDVCFAGDAEQLQYRSACTASVLQRCMHIQQHQPTQTLQLSMMRAAMAEDLH
jgi:hypothetical protein